MLASLRNILKSEDVLVDALRRKGVFDHRKIVLDFSSPNIAKTFHMGNLRRKILKAAGCEVTSINYLGDWGTQFAMLAAYWQEKEDKPSEMDWKAMSTQNKVELLTRLYTEANTKMESNYHFKERVQRLFCEMEDCLLAAPSGITQMEALKWCTEWRMLSREYLEAFYSRFYDVHFDEWQCESEQVAEGRRIADELTRRSIVQRSGVEDSWSVPEGRPGAGAVLRDLAAIYARQRRFNADEYVYVVERSQHKHFEQLKELVTALGDEELAAAIKHVSFGKIIGLSTRHGKNDSVDFLIARGELEARERLLQSPTVRVSEDEMPIMSNKLSRTVLAFDIMAKEFKTNYTFTFKSKKWLVTFKDALSPEGNTAVHLQEKHSRLNSLELMNSDLMEKLQSDMSLGRYVLTDQLAPTERLLACIADFDEAAYKAYTFGESRQMCHYLMRLARESGRAMAVLRVYGEVEKRALPRMLLLSAAKRILGDGMRLIGIEPMDKT